MNKYTVCKVIRKITEIFYIQTWLLAKNHTVLKKSERKRDQPFKFRIKS